jgi:hypothetical protein
LSIDELLPPDRRRSRELDPVGTALRGVVLSSPDAADAITVAISGYSDVPYEVPAGQWTGLPTVGRECVIVFDDVGDAWAVMGGVQAQVSNEAINVDSSPYNGDVQAAIDDAAAAPGGGRVFVPGGVRDFATPLNVPNFVELYGIGQGSILRAAGDNYVIGFAPGNRSSLHDFTVMAAIKQAAGGGIDFSAAQHNIKVRDVYFSHNLFIGMNVSPNQTGGIYWFDNLRWDGVINSGTALVIGRGAGLVTDVRVRGMVGTADPSAGSMGLWVSIPSNADTIEFTDSLWISGTLGIQHGTTSQVTNIEYKGCTVDGVGGVGVNVVNARVLKWIGGQISSCGGTAGFIIGNSAKHVGLLGTAVQNCAQDGVDIINGSFDSSVIDCDIFDNNQSNTASRFGIGVGANTTDFTIALNRIGNNRGIGPAGHQKYPIQIATGASDHYVVTNNTGRGNETSDAVVDNGTGTNKTVSGNIV